jgi:hypothetical protein
MTMYVNGIPGEGKTDKSGQEYNINARASGVSFEAGFTRSKE